jgi:hypothetical protein
MPPCQLYFLHVVPFPKTGPVPNTIYKSRPHSVIFTLGGDLYRIPKVVLTIVPPKHCRKVVYHTTKFSFFTICSKGEQKDIETTTTSNQTPSIQHKHVNQIATKHKYSFYTQCWHRGRHRVQCLTTHQQNPDYRTFWKHLRSMRSLTRGRIRGGYRKHVSITKMGHKYVIIHFKKYSINT